MMKTDFIHKDHFHIEMENELIPREKEFQLMSKGLGSKYVNANVIGWHKADLLDRMYIPLFEGKKLAMPRYYKEKIYSIAERARINKHYQQNVEKLVLDAYQEINRFENSMLKTKNARVYENF